MTIPQTPPETLADNTIWQACLLAMVGGYADSVGFLTFNAFAGAMTGNTVLLGISLAGQKFAAAGQSALIIAAFLLGVGLSAFLRHVVSLAALLMLEAAVIVAAALLAPGLAAPTLALAMGLQNAAITHFAGSNINTVVLTGNLQKLVEAVMRGAGRSGKGHGVAVLICAFWLAYLLGIVLGEIGWKTLDHPLLYAILPLPFVLVRGSTWGRAAD